MKGSDTDLMMFLFLVMIPILFASGIFSSHTSVNNTVSVPLPDSVTISLFYGYNNELDRTENWNISEAKSYEWGNCNAGLNSRSSQIFVSLHEVGVTSWDESINSSMLPVFLNTYKCSIRVE